MVNALFTPEYRLRVHLIITRKEVLALDATGRKAYIMNKFVPVLQHSNQLYTTTGIQFQFDPAKDVEYSAEAENLDGSGLQKIAQQYHGKVVVFHRGHSGNAGSRADFFHVETLDGDNFAHEMGHFLYLAHTFVEGLKLAALPEIIKQGVEADLRGQEALQQITKLLQEGVPVETTMPFDVQESIDTLGAVGTRILAQATDGDLGEIADTPPALHEYTPGKDEPPGFQYCQASFPITVTFTNGYVHNYEFTPDMHNIMGYGHFGGCKPRYFSNDQIKVMRNGISKGGRRHLTEAPLRWSGWAVLPGQHLTNVAPAAASLGNRIYVVSKGLDNRIYVISAQDGFGFEKWSEMPGGGTTDIPPAATSLGKRIYVIAKGVQNQRIYVNSAQDGSPFGNWAELPGDRTTNVALAAASLGSRIYVVSKGLDNRIYVISAQDGFGFEKWSEMPGNGTTDTSLAAASLGKRIYVISKGIQNKRIYVNSAQDGLSFGNWEQLPGDMRTPHALAATSLSGRLFVFAVGSDKHVYYVSAQDGLPFGKWIEIPIGAETNTPVAVATLGQRIYVFGKGLDNRIYVNSAILI
jgi:hypothetical protein